MFFIHKHSVAQQYGGPEEGGWWFDTGVPDEDWNPLLFQFLDEDDAYAACRALNESEHKRAEAEEEYGYSSVLSHRSTHYSYSVEDTPIMSVYPTTRPHYE